MRPAFELRLPSVLVGALVLGLLASSTAVAEDEAQSAPATAVLKTQSSRPDDRATARAVERVLRARLDELPVVDVAGTPELSLEDLQLAVGCMGENPSCLGAIAQQLEVDALVLSSLDRAGDAQVLTLVFFDSRTERRESVVRRVKGTRAGNELLEGINAQLHELFGLPAPEEPEVAEAPVDGATGEGTRDEVTEEGVAALPVVMLGAGVAALAGGGVLLALAQNNEDEYAGLEVRDVDDATRANDLFSKADRQTKAAYGLFAGGGALAATGVVLFFVMNGGDAEQEDDAAALSVTPTFGASGLGVRLAGSFGGAR
ncbi:MAG: hypothetical protein ACOCV4_05690 [Myxococcota bacterium]